MRFAEGRVFARARAIQVSLPLSLVAIYASANLVLAVALAAQPQRAVDLQLVHDWSSRWLRLAEDLYASTASQADYPPNAIVMFSPLAVLPFGAVVPLWAAVTFALTFVFACVVIRVTAPRATLAEAVWPALLFLCWGGARMLLQFTRLSVTLAYAAVWVADSKPMASGIFLGFALAKPQIAGPIALWMLFTRRWRPLAVASAVVALMTAIYLIRVEANPLGIAAGYWNILRDLYGAPALVGRTSIRRWTHAFAGDSLLADLLWVAGAGLLLLVPCGAAVAESTRRASRAAAAVPALFCLWSLLVWFHLGNNLVLIFPAFAFLLLLDDPATLRQRWSVAALLQIVLMLDVPVHLLAVAPRLGPLDFLVLDVDRFAVLTAFFYVAYLWQRVRKRPPTPGMNTTRHHGGTLRTEVQPW